MRPSDYPSSRWVLLRGLVRESAHWDDFPRRLGAALPGARVILVDLPGNGLYWRQDSPLTISGNTDFARAEVQRQSSGAPESPLFLFSVSLGSMVAIEWAQRYPQEVAGVVLINTSLGGLSPLYQRLSWRALPEMLAIVRERDVGKREGLILKLTSNAGPFAADLIRARVDAYRQHPVRLVNVARQLWAAARYRPAVVKPPVPVLLLNGQGDRMVSPRCTDALAKAWSIEPHCHPTAGHDLTLDEPEWTIAVVREWLQVLRYSGSSSRVSA